MLDPNKIALFFLYLQKGGEVELGGRNYVWLDNYVTNVIKGQEYGINGLAIKAISHYPARREEKPHYYMGAGDTPISYLLDRLMELPDSEWLRMARELKEMK